MRNTNREPTLWQDWPPNSILLEFSHDELLALVDSFEAINSIGKRCDFKPVSEWLRVAAGLSALDKAIRRAEAAYGR